MIDNKTINIISDLTTKYDLGKIKNIEIFKSSQNKVYKVTTDKNIYAIKEFSKDAISNYYYLKKRKEQLSISKKLNDNKIKSLLPLIFNNKYFISFNKHYYLIYNYLEEKPLTKEEVTIEHIKELAKNQSKIHKLNLESNLPCTYKIIKIDYDKYLKQSKKIDKELYKVLNENLNVLKIITWNCNRKLRDMKNNLCISHNDYKLLNILWKEYKMTLIDFDATGLSNPTCSLCESAFTFSKYDNHINYEYYKEYLNTYIKHYGKIKENYKDAMYVSFNGKLQWLSYMLSKNKYKKNNYIKETINMINELVLYYNNIDKFNDIYLEIKKND